MSSQEFWDRVEQCEHEWYPNYYEAVYCDTPYCGGTELHCMKCKVFVTTCGCGSNSGMSGWSMKRYNRWMRKKYGPSPYRFNVSNFGRV